MTYQDLKDKIYGCFFGGAIGDALGVGTEFMTADEIRVRYPRGLTDYSQIYRDAHRCRWQPGEWTSDTEIMMVLADALVESGGFDTATSAKALKQWFESNPSEVVPQMRWVLSQPDYLDDPYAVSERVVSNMKTHEAANEAVERSILYGIWNDADPEGDAVKACRLTHPHQRCVSCSSIAARIAADLLWKGEMTPAAIIDDIAAKGDPRTLPYMRLADADTLEPLDLDDEDSLWFTCKTLAAAVWALRHIDSPEKALDAIIAEGGDADTNAAVTMCYFGLKYGYDALPKHLVEGLTKRDTLAETADRFTLALASKHAIAI